MDCETDSKKRSSVQEMIASSPRLALALAKDYAFIPYMFTIVGQFSASGTPSADLDNSASPTDIDQDLLILNIDVDIQTPNSNAGDEFKPQQDWYYNATSGIQCAVRVQGFAARGTPYFPLKALPSLGVGGSGAATLGAFRKPWVLLQDQELFMDFSPTTALPSNSTIITCTFTCATSMPYPYKMDTGRALDELEACGYAIDPLTRKTFCAGC